MDRRARLFARDCRSIGSIDVAAGTAGNQTFIAARITLGIDVAPGRALCAMLAQAAHRASRAGCDTGRVFSRLARSDILESNTSYVFRSIRPKRVGSRAFSSEADIGSRQENASRQQFSCVISRRSQKQKRLHELHESASKKVGSRCDRTTHMQRPSDRRELSNPHRRGGSESGVDHPLPGFMSGGTTQLPPLYLLSEDQYLATTGRGGAAGVGFQIGMTSVVHTRVS